MFCLDCEGEPDTPRKLPLKSGKEANAMYDVGSYGPTFGANHDFMIANKAEAAASSYSNPGNAFECPSDFVTAGTCASHFAGSRNFVVSDYAVYVITATTD